MSKVLVGLDYPDAQAADRLVTKLSPDACGLKVGKELFTAAGPEWVSTLVARDYRVFLDLKFHDIPNTTAGACRAAARLGVWMLNVHASGGSRMMDAAREALESFAPRPKLIAVTVLTSLDDADLAELGEPEGVRARVVRLASMSLACGLDGVVCSALDLSQLNATKSFPEDFLRVTPGVRPWGSSTDDQRRVMSPREAIAAGAHYLVVGRPITAAADPVAALAAINAEIAEVDEAKPS